MLARGAAGAACTRTGARPPHRGVEGRLGVAAGAYRHHRIRQRPAGAAVRRGQDRLRGNAGGGHSLQPAAAPAHHRQDRRRRRRAIEQRYRLRTARAGARHRRTAAGQWAGRRHAARTCPSAARVAPCAAGRQRTGRPEAHAFFLLGLPAQHLDRDPAGQQGAGRHRLPRHGAVRAPEHVGADPDGRRRRAVDRAAPLHDTKTRVPESGRRHLLPLGPAGDPRRGRQRRQHHLQDPLQRCGGHDRRATGRRADLTGASRPPTAPRRRADHRAGERRPRAARCGRAAARRAHRAPRPAGRRAARAARDGGLHGVAVRADLRCREAPPQEARRAARSRQAAVHQCRSVRRLRRLFGAVQLRQHRAAGNGAGPQAAHQPVVVQQGLFVPEGLLPFVRHRHRRQAQAQCRGSFEAGLRRPAGTGAGRAG